MDNCYEYHFENEFNVIELEIASFAITYQKIDPNSIRRRHPRYTQVPNTLLSDFEMDW